MDQVCVAESITNAYLIAAMNELNEWCKKNNPDINDFQGKVIEIAFHIQFADDSHPFLLLQEHPQWIYEYCSHQMKSVDQIVRLHLGDYIKRRLWSGLFKYGLPGFNREEQKHERTQRSL